MLLGRDTMNLVWLTIGPEGLGLQILLFISNYLCRCRNFKFF